MVRPAKAENSQRALNLGVDVPLLLVFARQDQVVSLNALDTLWSRVASTDKQQLILERGGHIVTEDYDKVIAFEAIVQFLKQHTSQ